MRFKRRKRSDTANLVLAAGVALTGAAAAFAISRLLRSGPVARRLDLRGLEKRVIQALLNDEVTKSQPIDIAAVGSGVVEVSGTVDQREHVRHVVDLIDRVPGVHVVVNRLDVHGLEGQLRQNRKRNESQNPRWYGGSVGIGKRRQSFTTDPARRDDHATMLSRSLQPSIDDVLTDVEETEGTGVRIGMSNSTGPLTTRVSAHSPDAATDKLAEPPAVAPHEMAQRE